MTKNLQDQIDQIVKDMDGFIQLCCATFVAIQKILKVDSFNIDTPGGEKNGH